MRRGHKIISMYAIPNLWPKNREFLSCKLGIARFRLTSMCLASSGPVDVARYSVINYQHLIANSVYNMRPQVRDGFPRLTCGLCRSAEVRRDTMAVFIIVGDTVRH